ncbi:MAG TPA: molybdopterin-dependent oxidoreductase [Bacteroidales bacterium]|nr:molybdopterin-dependent oxidoreductase [Bacteroidales bacterium]
MADSFFNIVLDGNIVKGTPGETILELAQRHGIPIPTLCHDDRLEPFTSCYLCVVEVEGMKGHQPACSTKIAEGMKIVTMSEGIRKSRKMALELLLSNHYADCLGPCTQTCPAGVDVQGYISLIEKGLYSEAVALIKETNPLPAICGRVCVRPCEAECRRNLLDEGAPVGIDYLKRFASDADLASPGKFVPEKKPSTGKKIAVIGAGPGGLSAAYFLQVMGHQADIFEAAPKSGGWLRYGIPEYRLPNDILDQEVKNITDLGVTIRYNKKLGGDLSYQELKEKYDATILTIGSQKGTGVGCEGEDAVNVFSGIDFLKNMEVTGQRYDFRGKTIAVVGGGNTAMDCCRTSIRCHADKVYVIYRRTEKEMPANPIEIHESKLEGVEYKFLTLPGKIHKNEKGEVESMTCIRMELGEPDASGRRRPVPVEGSDFNIQVDYILAAIGQKTDVNFIDDINAHAEGGQLKINKWGDIDADKSTLVTGIPSVFAAGDGVTGPATIIEAIAQAKIAANSAHQFVTGLPVQPLKKPFLSKKENFKKQVKEDYSGRFAKQLREEMPTLPAEKRNNFSEVELGYQGEEVAYHESQRCLECGCMAFFNCDLQKYATEYNAFQKQYEGEFRQYEVDFRHPYIEIDNNKCILCGRCIRMCREVVGANALGFIKRGFDTYVAPSMGNSLTDTPCESCGMCIATCPTGAILENVIFKPGPVKTEQAETICNYCSVGCAITLNHRQGFVMSVTGRPGNINGKGVICRFPKFGYGYLNDPARILKPMVKKNGKFREISFKEAFTLIREKISAVKPEENAFFAGARLSNEEMHLVKRLAKEAVRTEHLGSFHYLGRGDQYRFNAENNVPFKEHRKAGKFYLIGTEINRDHAIPGFMVNNDRAMMKVPVVLVTAKDRNSMEHKVDEVIRVRSYYHFVRAVNHWLLTNRRENALFLRDRVKGWEEYKSHLLKEDFEELLKKSGMTDPGMIAAFADDYNKQMNAVIVFSEKEISAATSAELFNLALITGKLGKTASGILSLKEKNNSQGIFDTGIVSRNGKDLPERLGKGAVKNLFIFGEDPAGCAVNGEAKKWLDGASFKVVQDYFLTETAKSADLVLPASFPAETGGTFTNTQKMIQEFGAVMEGRIEMNNLEQLAALLKEFGVQAPSDPDAVLKEIIAGLPGREKTDPEEAPVYHLKNTGKDDPFRIFEYGCDHLTKRFEEEFEASFVNQKP